MSIIDLRNECYKYPSILFEGNGEKAIISRDSIGDQETYRLDLY